MQAYVRTLESQLAGKRSSDAATNDVALTLQRREEECFELHRKLEVLVFAAFIVTVVHRICIPFVRCA